MDTLILKKIRDKTRQDIPDEFIIKQMMRVRHEGWSEDEVIKLVHTYFEFDERGNIKKENVEAMPKELKKLFLDASNVYPEPEDDFDPLAEPLRGSFYYDELIKKGESLGKDKLRKLGLE